MSSLRWKLASRLRRFDGSAAYWSRRYRAGGDSGVGSYGQLARFKAEVLNTFVAEHRVGSVVELGCGDGHQLSLANYPRYLGLDVAPEAIRLCREQFAGDATKSFMLYDTRSFTDPAGFVTAELAMSLDVLFHLVEDDVFDGYLRHLFGAATRFVAIYSSDAELPDPARHVRHRAFTPWVEAHAPGWRLLSRVDNPHPDLEGAVAGFAFYERVGS